MVGRTQVSKMADNDSVNNIENGVKNGFKEKEEKLNSKKPVRVWCDGW